MIKFLCLGLLFLLPSISLVCQPELSHKFDERVNTLLEEYAHIDGPGIAISVVKEGKIIYQRQKGFANLEYMIPITDSTKFVVGSIAKQFTAFAILLLEEEGKLSIDDDIRRYLPELSDIPQPISIRQLANHTSGFRNNDDLINLIGHSNQDLVLHEEMLNLLLRQKALNFEPGSRFQYCNAGYVLMTEIVNRVSGMSFAEFVQEHIFKPLKMDQSLFLDNPGKVVKNKAQSYVLRSQSFEHVLLNRTFVGSTGLYSNTHDLSLWAMNFDNPIVGNEKVFAKMGAESSLNNGEAIPYGLGQESKIYKGLKVFFHGGGDAGFRSYLVRVPSQQFSVIVTGNFEAFNPLNISYGLIDLFLADLIEEPAPKELPKYSNKDLQAFTGTYQVFPGLYTVISAKNDSLFFRFYGSDQDLFLPVFDEKVFDFPYLPHSKVVFEKDQLTWHLSDFFYPSKRVELDPPSYDEINTSDYLGSYRSNEVETIYSFEWRDDHIVATHNFSSDITLRPIAKDAFISNRSFFGRVEFIRDDKGRVSGCKISGQSSYDVLFEKID